MTDRRANRHLFLVALVLLVVLRMLPVMLLDVHPTSDLEWYFGRALGILNTGEYAEEGLPTAYWPVGYPGFLAGVMALFGPSLRACQLANLVLSLACALLMRRWCLIQFGNDRAATLSVLLLAVYPNHIGYTIGIYSEPLFTLLLLAVCLLLISSTSLTSLIIVGVLAGAAALVKAQMLLVPPMLVLLSTARHWSWAEFRNALRRVVIVCTVMAATIAPWTWRNYEQFGAFIPISTNGGMSLLAGNNDMMNLSLRSDFAERGSVFDEVGFSVADQVQADRRARAAARDWIKSNPGMFLLLMPKKFIRLWLPDGESEWNLQRGFSEYPKYASWIRSVRIVNQLFYWLVIVGMLVALRLTVDWRNPRTLVVPMLLLYFSAISMVFSGQSRYHAPLMPFALAYCALAYVEFRRRRLGAA